MTDAAAPRVVFQGERGAYSEEAVGAYWGGADRAEPVPARECDDVARAVAAGEADFGVLAVENTLAGSVAAAYDALVAGGVRVVGEVVLPIRHCVLALPNVSLGALEAVESHPVALAQCRAFLRRHPRLVARPAYDTAGAARALAERGDRRAGAIASRAAAACYGLAVVAEGVEDREDNRTRFVVLARAAGAPPALGTTLGVGAPARTSLVATIADEPGTLGRLLRPFADAGLSVSAPVARPTGEPWLHHFFLDVAHEAGDGRVAGALDAARAATVSLRVLGTYARDGTGAGR